jgi:phage shock protein A
MGQLFNRISRVVRAEMNSSKSDCDEIYLNKGAALVAGGAVTGASIGKVGILAGGTGYSLGAVPLAAVGALTGAALYEALRSLIEGDASSASAAAIGAAAGAATSATIGGVGVAVGGSAIGVGMASMAVGGTVVGLGLVGLNRLLQQGIDPEELLDSAIEQMEADLQNARKASINVIASQKRLQQHCEQAQAEVNKWERLAQLALQKGDEYLAREALIRKKTHSGILSSLKVSLNQEPTSVEKLKQNLTLLEAKISEAKNMRTSLKARIATAKLNGQLSSTAGRMDTSAMTAVDVELEDLRRKIDQL